MELHNLRYATNHMFDGYTYPTIKKLLPFQGTVEQILNYFIKEASKEELVNMLKHETMDTNLTIRENIKNAFQNIFGNLDLKVHLIDRTDMTVEEAILQYKGTNTSIGKCIDYYESIQEMIKINSECQAKMVIPSALTIEIPSYSLVEIVQKYREF